MASSPIPYALGIHTTTPQFGLCYSRPDIGLKTQTWDLGRDMSTQLHEHLFSFVSPHDVQRLEFIAVAIGPGGFTSTRLGVVTARTLAQQLNLPLFGISSLAAYVWHSRKHADSPHHDSGVDAVTSKKLSSTVKRTAVQMPARRGQVFGAVYDMIEEPQMGQSTSAPPHQAFISHQIVPHKADHVIDEEDWTHYLHNHMTEPWTALNINGVLGYTVSSVIELATFDYLDKQQSHWSTVYPFYGQSPV